MILLKYIVVGSDGTKWRKMPWKVTRTAAHNILVKLPGVVGHTAKNAKNETDCWRLFFDERILTLLIENTNAYINSIKQKFTRSRDCEETDKIEIEAFIGLLYFAGVFRGSHQNLLDFWSTDGLGIDIFRMTMSERRFRFLVRCVRFDNRSTRVERCMLDKLAAVREMFSYFLENCKLHYHLGQNVTIDEMLPAFRGRCAFRQYIPSKPNKYGIKFFSYSMLNCFIRIVWKFIVASKWKVLINKTIPQIALYFGWRNLFMEVAEILLRIIGLLV